MASYTTRVGDPRNRNRSAVSSSTISTIRTRQAGLLNRFNGVVRLVISEGVADLIAERGGRLYVWPNKARCCGGLITLVTSTTEPKGEFRRVATSDRFELLVPAELQPLPEELHLDVRRYPRGVEAYWNGCAWVI